MSPLSVIPDRPPFALPALPGFIATMGASDFRQPPPSSSLLTLVQRCAAPSTPTAGPPWFPRNLYVRLDTAYDPGAVPPTRHRAKGTVACWRLDTIGRPQHGLFGNQHLQGQHHLLSLHLASFRDYASINPLPN
jgi:hypothetical protein